MSDLRRDYASAEKIREAIANALVCEPFIGTADHAIWMAHMEELVQKLTALQSVNEYTHKTLQ